MILFIIVQIIIIFAIYKFYGNIIKSELNNKKTIKIKRNFYAKLHSKPTR